MSYQSLSPDALGSPCARCSRILSRETARVTPEGPIVCKCKIEAQRLAWLRRHHPERLGDLGDPR